MKYAHVFSLLVVAGLFSSSQAAALTLIAGSGGSPPDFSPSFLGLLDYYDLATPFEVPSDSKYAITHLQLAVFHYPDSAGDRAFFAIHADAAGLPGAELARVIVGDIPETEQIITVELPTQAVVEPGNQYWLAGGTLEYQTNWNIPTNVFGQVAVRDRRTGAWRVQSGSTNIPVFAVLGTAVPEPGTAVLFVASIIRMSGSLRSPRLAARLAGFPPPSL